MKSVLIFLISIFFISNLNANEDSFKIGMLYEKIFLSKKEAKIGAKLWIMQMEEKDKRFNIKVIFYEDEKKLIEDYQNKKVDVIVSTATLYYQNKKIIDDLSAYKWIMSSSSYPFDKYYLIKNKNLKFDFATLASKKIYYKDDMTKIWLDSVLYKNKKISGYTSYIKVSKENKLIFNPFFNEDDLAIIPKDLYDSLIKLNPQIEKKVDIVIKSEAIFFNGIGFTRKNSDEESETMINLMREKLITEDNGLDITSFIDVQNIYMLKKDSLYKLDKFYEEYFMLKKVYK